MAYDPDIQPLIDAIKADLAALDARSASADATNASATARVEVDLTKSVSNTAAALASLDARLKKLEGGTVTPPPPVVTPTTSFPGDVAKGTIRWGCSYNSNGVPSPHETAAGVPVGVRRTFWDMSKTASLIATAKGDIAAKRVPWVSVKPLMPWIDVAAGKLDVQLTTLFKALGALPGPVWFTMHHEPEGGNGTAYPDDGPGSEIHWRNMQKQVRKVLDASGAKNIAFASVLMAWTFDSRSGRTPSDWWVDNIWDFAGIDHYTEADSTTMRTAMWNNTVAFYKAKNLRIALGEWGNKDHGLTGAAEMQEWYNHLISIGSPGACYFDTSLNGGVPLSGEVLTKFRELMKAPTSVRL
jgi:hypothetical protein